MTPRTLAAVWLLPLAALAQPAPLLSIDDPEGDDVGDGALVYPRDGAYAPGDLDLRSLRVYAAGNELRFEATFRNPIRDPASARGTGLGSEDLSVFARRGFYAFNLDIYLDIDRIAGSGNTVALPGRRASFDPAHAWDKAIVLTPRPELMKRQFADTLAKAAPTSPGDIAATIEQSVHFATEVRVRGRTVSFTVPTTFVDAKALAGASLTAMVTLAKPTVEAEFSLLGSDARPPLERLTLGAAQPEPGRPLAAMGYSTDRAPATAIVDLLSPDPRQQAMQLAPGGRLTGLDRDHAVGALSAATAVAAPAPVPAAPAPTSGAGGSWFSRALDRVASWFGVGAAASTPAATATAAQPQSLQSLMAPAAAAPAPVAVSPTPAPAAAPRVSATAPAIPAVVAPAVVPAAAPPANPPVPAAERARPRDAAFMEEQELRLRTLERLRKNGLITEAEYQHKRKEVLDAL